MNVERIQQRRTKGWKAPANTISVARPSKWGNPYIVERVSDDEWAVGYRFNGHVAWVGSEPTREAAHRIVVGVYRELIILDRRDLTELRGKNLMCFCPLDQPCHADVLLELANRDMNAHTEHVTVEAWSADCIEGECDHVDEDGMPDDLSACPSFPMEVCVDCQVERGLTNDPAWWEGALSPWPHELEDREPTPPLVPHGPDPEPPIFKPSPYRTEPS